jgi:hypothetical protein
MRWAAQWWTLADAAAGASAAPTMQATAAFARMPHFRFDLIARRKAYADQPGRQLPAPARLPGYASGVTTWFVSRPLLAYG